MSERASSPVVVHRGRGERILYVDDEEPLALLGMKILERLNYAVDWHTKAGAALDAVRAKPDKYDLVVTDQLMPGMTGSVLAEHLRTIRPDLPVILTTGFTANITVDRIRELGIRKLIMKPLTVESLGEAVHEVLSLRRGG